jgi:hypothetical protein
MQPRKKATKKKERGVFIFLGQKCLQVWSTTPEIIDQAKRTNYQFLITLITRP